MSGWQGHGLSPPPPVPQLYPQTAAFKDDNDAPVIAEMPATHVPTVPAPQQRLAGVEDIQGQDALFEAP